MWATDATHRLRGATPGRQRGVAAVEVAILAIVFFIIVFNIVELARSMYIINTVHESTRYAANAAALVSYRDNAALDQIRQRAVFHQAGGTLPLGAPISDASVRIDYMALLRASDGSLSLQEIAPANLPNCPRQNREICMANPHASNCIRFVRARICAEGDSGSCTRPRFEPALPLVPLAMDIPHATTIRMTESFGSMPEGTPCL